MKKRLETFAGLALVLASAGHAKAQLVQVTLPVDPRLTYLRLCHDNDHGHLVIDLWALGLEAGDLVMLETLGGIQPGFSFPYNSSNWPVALVGLFSSSPSIQSHEHLYRVTDAIQWGEPFWTRDACVSGGGVRTDTDIPHDFFIPGPNTLHQPGGRKSTILHVPPSGRYLFLSADDSYFNDNSDPNQNYQLRISELCYANCDQSTTAPILNVDDFTCFINAYAEASSLPYAHRLGHYANCDQSTSPPILDINDFTCFTNSFAAGCP